MSTVVPFPPRPTLRDMVLDPALVNPVAHTICKSVYGDCACSAAGNICQTMREPAAFALAVARKTLRERV